MTIITYLVVKLSGHLGVIMVFDRHIWRDYGSTADTHRIEVRFFSALGAAASDNHTWDKSHSTRRTFHSTTLTGCPDLFDSPAAALTCRAKAAEHSSTVTPPLSLTTLTTPTAHYQFEKSLAVSSPRIKCSQTGVWLSDSYLKRVCIKRRPQNP